MARSLSYVYDFAGGSRGMSLRWQEHFRVGEARIADGLGGVIPPRLADLLDLATAVYVADRLAPRRHRHPRFRRLPTWSRSFQIRLGVRDRAFWVQPAIAGLISEFLTWLTDDAWGVSFVARVTSPRASETQLHLFPPSSRDRAQILMFSGGIDSLAGVFHLLDRSFQGPLVLVSVGGNRRLGAIQRSLVGALHERAHDLRWIRVPIALAAHFASGARERSQRTRGFLFLAFGATAAALARSDSLYMFENGIGAINLPLLEVQLSAQSSRTVHPLTQRYGERLISLIVERQFEIRNPFLFRTKAEVCTTIPEAYAHLLGSTESCDNFAQRVAGRPRCGACTSCVLRAQALMASRRWEFESLKRYRRHPLASPMTDALTVSLMQVDVLRSCLKEDDPWPSLCYNFPAVADVPCAIWGKIGELLWRSARIEVVDLLRRYVAEWSAIGYDGGGVSRPEVNA